MAKELELAYPHTLDSPLKRTARLPSVDILRGIAMVVMALDHTRDWFSNSTALFDPLDLSRTTPELFFTRWITHFCAPIFVFLAGSSAYLALSRGRNRTELARFLAIRGLWLIFLEIFVISPFGWSFAFGFAFTRLQVIWVIGVSMVILGGLVLICSSRFIGLLGFILIFTHDLFDGGHARWLGAFRALHQIAFFPILPHKIVGSVYPLIPWVGVMMVGYGAGEVLLLRSDLRRRALLNVGGAAVVLFFLLRVLNIYGDPSPWSNQPSLLFTVLSFVRCSKYPPSLLYLLMTLGPALILLGALEGRSNWLAERFEVFGQVPLFYYLLHLPLLHGIAVLFSVAKYGDASWLYQDGFMLSRSAHPIPAGYGYALPVVYAVWLSAVFMLYPVCQWFAGMKRRGRHPLLSYL